MSLPKQLDARGLKCPMPVLSAQKTLRDAPSGTMLELLADDAASWEEVPLFCKQAGYELAQAIRAEDGSAAMAFLIRKP